MTENHLTSGVSQEEIQSVLLKMGRQAKKASYLLANASTEDKNRWLLAMADALEHDTDLILKANLNDMETARKNGLSEAMLDRLMLDPARVRDIAQALRHVVTLPDPANRILSSTVRPNGLRIDKVSVPIGVIGIIYESRPNVTVDAAGLCLKAGNAVILRGGSEAFHSNMALTQCIASAAEAAGMPHGAVQLIPMTDHAAVSVLLKMDQYLSLIIPRGGERLIRMVVNESTIPVIKHYKGVCHIFVEKTCDQEQALKIIENAKCQRPGTCNAVETLLIHRPVVAEFLPKLYAYLKEKNVEMVGDASCRAIIPEMGEAVEEDWYTEYLCKKISIKVVESVEEAVDHINHYGSGHSDSILTQDEKAAEYFLNHVDSAAVYVNASTRFTDGGEFGMGAEIGISTDKLHARGPMGLPELTSYKYKIYGNGQIR